MILAGDIGGTKTVLALYSEKGGLKAGAEHEKRFRSSDYDSLETIVEEFLEQMEGIPSTACFGVAGPVVGQKSQITNLPWQVSAAAIAHRFHIRRVKLVNDLVALASAVPHLQGADLCPLNSGTIEPRGNIAVVAPGTGLGTAFLVWSGQDYMTLASEGGHATFSPTSDQEIELLRYLRRRYRHVSFERVCSGGHLPGIYEFLLESGSFSEPAWLKKELAGADDRTPVIVGAALEKQASLCVATLDLFVRALGTAISNMSITILPKGGIYLGGGIPPRILPRLQQPDFLEAVAHKGRFFEMTSKIPVTVIMKPKTALFGAARTALEMAAEQE